MNDRFFAERFFLIFSKYFDFATVRLPDQTATLPITWRDICYNGIFLEKQLFFTRTTKFDVSWSIGGKKYHMIPTPVEGEGGGGDKAKLSNSIFFAWKPWDSIQPLKWNCKVTFLNKPWALVRKYLRLAPEELSASMMTAAQFLEGCHPYICAASV